MNLFFSDKMWYTLFTKTNKDIKERKNIKNIKKNKEIIIEIQEIKKNKEIIIEIEEIKEIKEIDKIEVIIDKMIYNTLSLKIREISNIETFNECYPYGIEILNYV